MIKFTANYCFSNSNFIITNLPNSIVDSNYSNILLVVQNLISRGNPTIASDFLRKKLELDRNYLDTLEQVKFLSSNQLEWIRTIKGYKSKDYFPAYKFYTDFRKILKSVGFIADLTVAEYPIINILPEVSEAFHKQSVDFYIPILKTVIEIDGKQHKNQKEYDSKRDQAFRRNGINVLRISTDKVNSDDYSDFLSEFRQIYKEYKNDVDAYAKWIDSPKIQIETQITLSSIARFQIFILELLNRGVLRFNMPYWNFHVSGSKYKSDLELAIQDLELWISNISALFNEYIDLPHVNIEIYESLSDIPNRENGIVVDFDLFKRWDDSCDIINVYQIRSDFDDNANYFQVKISDPVVYAIDESIHSKNLEYVLLNLYGYEKFNDGQLQIIINCLNGEDTIGLLPTGGGKSLTYQICALLQPALSYVVVPIKSLMLDQVEGLAKKHHITHTSFINSDLESSESSRRLNDFTNGKYFYVLISPERFQNKIFREELELINRTKAISLAVIDEVHCLSEWGHDFRTSYLALSNTINRITPSVRYLALTATASSKVLQDIMNELKIPSEHVLTIPNFNRPELEFEIIPVNQSMRDKRLIELIQSFKSSNSQKSGCLVFTQTVNGPQGCYQLSKEIGKSTGYNTTFYCGSSPKKWEGYSSSDFTRFKDDVQKKFMNDDIDVLVATKSFGMGIDKGNIRLTVHYGLPASLESFYQEAGRAGRDKQKSNCKVLYVSDFLSNEDFEVLFGVDSQPKKVKKVTKELKGDLSTLMYFLSNNIVEIETEAYKIHYFFQSNQSEYDVIEVTWLTELDREQIEKNIYKLALVGCYVDWTVDYKNKKFEITKSHLSEDEMVLKLCSHIQKYDYTFNLLDQQSGTYNELYDHFNNSSDSTVQKLLYILLKWTNDNILYSRKRSMLLMKEYAEEFTSSEELQEKIELYFKRNDDVYFLEKIVGKREKLKEWFRIFFVSESGKEDLVRNRSAFKSLKVTLNRFLESYDNDISLNLINGLLSLATGDFNKKDGRDRLIKAMNEISKLSAEEKDEMFSSILLTSHSILENDQMEELSELLIEAGFNSMKELKKINRTYDDIPSYVGMISLINHSILESSSGGYPWEK